MRFFALFCAVMALIGALPLPADAGPLRDMLKARREGGEGEGRGDRRGRNAEAPAGMAVTRDIAYGREEAQKFDLYIPEGARQAPVLLYIHGGGWRRGDKGGKNMIGAKLKHWGSKGYALISANYRMMPEANPLLQAEDVSRLIAFVQENAAQLGLDGKHILLMGHSAGAHIVALISADAGLPARMGARPWLATVAIDSAALDIVSIMNRKHYGLYDEPFGTDPAFWQATSPLHQLKGRQAAPILIVCSSTRDDSCPPAEAYAAKAKELGGKAQVLPVPLNHGKINSELGQPGAYTDAVDTFLRHAVERSL